MPLDLQRIAEQIVGPLKTIGSNLYCECPGKSFHTGHNSNSDCKVFLTEEGPSTLFCFHTSCESSVALANKKLRGDIWRNKMGIEGIDPSKKRRRSSLEVQSLKKIKAEADRINAIKAEANLLKYEIFSRKINASRIGEVSPEKIPDDDREQFLMHLSLFKEDDVLWIGNTTDSGDGHESSFRSVKEWRGADCHPGNFTTGSVFKRGICSRSNDNVSMRRYLVVESDTLEKNDICSVFWWLAEYVHLRMILDTGGKSLHGWFDVPCGTFYEKLKIILPVLGCDRALFKPSQPVRMAGATRGDRMQKMLWYRKNDLL